MLSLTCKTAIKAVIYLASKSDDNLKAGIIEIAEYINASEHTTGKFLQVLVKNKIINSAKGPNGGFYISQQQLKFPLIKIIFAIDGDQVFNECGLGLSKCSSNHPCPIHEDYKIGRDAVEKLFKVKTIANLIQPVKGGLVHLIG